MKGRIQKLIASSGLCSRRKAEELIRQGRVTVNGGPASIGDSADLDVDVVEVDGVPVNPEGKVYFALHKPVGYESTLGSTTGKPLVTELVDTDARIFPVGRLDVDTSGLILLTNDGELAHMVMHPCSLIDKVYIVTVNGNIGDAEINRLKSGIQLEEAMTWTCDVEPVRRGSSGTVLRMTIHEGRKRQVRRMLSAVGFEVTELVRERVGNVTLAGLDVGEYRALGPDEVEELRRLASISAEVRE